MNALVIVDTYFPNGVAISSRMKSFCMLLKSLNYKVHVICAYSTMKDMQKRRVYELEGFSYEVVFEGHPTSVSSFIGEKGFLKYVKHYIAHNKVDLMLSNSSSLYFWGFANLAKKYHFPYLVEQCEWFDISSYKFRKIDIRYIVDEFLKQHGYRKADGIIAISRLLDNHFTELNIPTTRIPTILDVEKIEYAIETNNDKKIIVYTGNCGKSKEYLKPVLEALANNEELRNKIELHIYGPSRATVIQNIENNQELLKTVESCTFIHGRVSQEEIKNILLNADYQIFLRPNRRSSDAGFPTKLGESMSVGTPVIANNTGDIGLYLKTLENGFCLNSSSSSEVEKVLKEITRIDKETYRKMRESARKTAEVSFDYRCYINQMNSFIEMLRKPVENNG